MQKRAGKRHDVSEIREKDLDEENFAREVAQLRDVCNAHGVHLQSTTAWKLCWNAGADGMHVGQSDIRAMIGPEKIRGISAGIVEEAVQAQKAGADYIGLGAVFGTSTKKSARNLRRGADPRGGHRRHQRGQYSATFRQRRG